MPSIPVYQQRTNVSGNVWPGPNARSGAGILGQALGQVAQDAETVLQLKKQQQLRAQQEADQSALIEANSTEMNLRSRWAESMVKRKQEAPPGADGFVPKVLDDYDTEAAETLKGVKNQKARNYLQERFADIRLSLQNDALQFESGSRSAYKKGQLESSTNSAMTAARLRPQDFDSILMAQQGTMTNVGLTEAERAGALPAMRSSIASAAVEGLIERDPYATLKALRDEKSGGAVGALDYGARDQLISAAQSEIGRRETAARARQAEQRDILTDDVQNAFAARQMGIPATLPGRDKFMAAYGADGAGRYNAAASQWKAYDVAGTAASMPPDQAAQYLDSLKPKTQEGAADARDAYTLAVKLYSQQRERLEADPVGTLLQTNQELAAAREQADDDPTNYFRKLLSTQQALGVEKPKLLTDSERTSVAKKLDFDPARPRARTEALAQIRQTYGDYYVDVMREVAPKLEGQARVMIDMNPEQAVRLDAAMAQKSELNKVVVGTAESDIKAQIDTEFEDLANTLGDNVDGPARLAEFREAAELLAKADVLRGSNPQEAARKAAAAVVNDQYHYVGTMRIPVAYDPDLITHGAALAQDSLSKDGKFSITPGRYSDDAQAQTDLRSLIKRQGYWVTNEDGTGLVLRIPARTGQGNVYKSDGSRVELTWDQLENVDGADREQAFTPMRDR